MSEKKHPTTQPVQDELVSTWASGYWQGAELGFSRWASLAAAQRSKREGIGLRLGSLLAAFLVAAASLLWATVRWLWEGAIEPLALPCLVVTVVLGIVLRRSLAMRNHVHDLVEQLQAGQLEEAIERVDAILAQDPPPWARALLVELQARAWVGLTEPLQAHLALQRLPENYSPSLALQGALLLCEGEAAAAVALLEQSLKDSQDDGVASILSAAYLMCNRPKDAAAVVQGRRSIGRPLYNQIQAALVAEEAYVLAIAIGTQAFQRFKNADDAYFLACLCCRAQQNIAENWQHQACDWLKRASAAGCLDAETLVEDPELACLRTTAAFAALVSQLRKEGDRVARVY